MTRRIFGFTRRIRPQIAIYLSSLPAEIILVHFERPRRLTIAYKTRETGL
jgi:hypothetical protein